MNTKKDATKAKSAKKAKPAKPAKSELSENEIKVLKALKPRKSKNPKPVEKYASQIAAESNGAIKVGSVYDLCKRLTAKKLLKAKKEKKSTKVIYTLSAAGLKKAA